MPKTTVYVNYLKTDIYGDYGSEIHVQYSSDTSPLLIRHYRLMLGECMKTRHTSFGPIAHNYRVMSLEIHSN
jgi:hypothetical protein